MCKDEIWQSRDRTSYRDQRDVGLCCHLPVGDASEKQLYNNFSKLIWTSCITNRRHTTKDKCFQKRLCFLTLYSCPELFKFTDWHTLLGDKWATPVASRLKLEHVALCPTTFNIWKCLKQKWGRRPGHRRRRRSKRPSRDVPQTNQVLKLPLEIDVIDTIQLMWKNFIYLTLVLVFTKGLCKKFFFFFLEMTAHL